LYQEIKNKKPSSGESIPTYLAALSLSFPARHSKPLTKKRDREEKLLNLRFLKVQMTFPYRKLAKILSIKWHS
jgi:hypothetical protein